LIHVRFLYKNYLVAKIVTTNWQWLDLYQVDFITSSGRFLKNMLISYQPLHKF